MRIQQELPFANVWATSMTTAPDGFCLTELIGLHALGDDPYILDATYGRGAIWEGCAYRPDLSMDKRPLPGVHLVDDFTVMLSIADASIDVLVFDPPHLPTAAASAGSSGMWADRYGITDDDPLREADNVIGLFGPFLAQAARVLQPNGIVLAKIADIVHNHRYQWQAFAFVQAARDAGLCACDCMIRADPASANLKSGHWETQKHLRHAHVYWIVARKGRCERP
jgi:hypothetical protein